MSKSIIALVGNPNCGKTTLFNGLTGGNIKTGNWPGVTVEKREGIFKSGDDKITIVDLPGIYSFSAHSEDEKVARDFVLSGEPSLIINIIDGTNMERNLYLTTQLLEMKVPIILVVNMMDILSLQFFTRRLVDHLAAVQDSDTAAQFHAPVEIMGGHHHRPLVRPRAGNNIIDYGTGTGVESYIRFIEKQNRWSMENGTGE